MSEIREVAQMSPDETAALVNSEAVHLLDVREPHEWDEAHVLQAIHVPLGDLTADRVPSDKPVVVMCHLGGRSQMAAEALVAAGVDARNMSGGIVAWSQADLPLVTQ